MCGICGVIQIEGRRRPVLARMTLERMTDVMTHRGPDDKGIHIADGVALGVRRLSIVDLAGGHQPLANEDGSIWAVQNGELYNQRDLRTELTRDGHRFQSQCDTEVLPHLYERDGTSLAGALRGEFAIAIWDPVGGRAVLARDRMGVKPLYYARSGEVLVFASELKSLLASGLISPTLDSAAIGSYLTLGYFAGPSTPLRGVFKLLPGHSLILENGSVREERYWALPTIEPGLHRPSEREYAAQLLEVLDESVRLQLMSDVPLGAMLSGGLDSSVIVALMARHSSTPVKTFSVAFAGDGPGNELADARLVAEACGTDHHELELPLRDASLRFEELVWTLDEPLADLSSLGLYALSRLAVQSVTVGLCGQGADELLGGYPTHRNAALADRWRRLPGPLRASGPLLARMVPRRYARAAAAITATDPISRFFAQSSKLALGERSLLRGQAETSAEQVTRDLVRQRLAGQGGTALASTLYLHQQLGLADDMLHYFDRASMANSLELRVPFLDHHVVEFCARVPDELKVRGTEGKRLLRTAARGLVPDRVIDKKKIGFFSHAVGGWFQEQAGSLVADYLLQPDPAYAEFVDRGAVEALVSAEPGTSTPRSSSLLLSLLMLEVWLKTYLPRALDRGSEPVAI